MGGSLDSGCENCRRKGIATSDTLDVLYSTGAGLPERSRWPLGEHYKKCNIPDRMNNLQAVYGEPRLRVASPWYAPPRTA